MTGMALALKRAARAFLACAVVHATFSAQAVSELPGWRGDFVNCTNEAIQANQPLVLVWANRFCGHCAELEEDLQRAAFTAWKADKEYIFCFVEGTGINAKDPDTAPGAKEFARTACGTKTGTPSSYPFVCVYWQKSDGTVSAMRFSTESAVDVAKAATLYFKGWTPYRDPDRFSFPISGEAFDRLEAVSATRYVDVPVVS